MNINTNNLAEHIESKLGAVPEGKVRCRVCGYLFPLFALTKDEENRWRCGSCRLDKVREDRALADAEAALQVQPWDSETGNGVKAQRNALLERWRWTIMPDSPLTLESQAQFLAYVQALNRITVDFPTPAEVVWPETPELIYPGLTG